MKKISLLLLSIIFLSCSIEYDGETKLITKGRVVNAQNEPIANISVSVYNEIIGSSGGFIFPGQPSENIEIAKTTTNANGEFLLIYPKPKNQDQTVVTINEKETNGIQIKKFSAISDSNFEDYTLDFENIKLYQNSELVDLNIELNQVNYGKRLIEFKIIGEDGTKEVLMNPFLFSEVDYYTYFYPGFHVKKNQIILLRCKIFDSSLNQSYSENIELQIGTEPVNYILTL